MLTRFSRSFSIVTLVAIPASLSAQCATAWLPFGIGTGGVFERARSLLALPDGSVVAGGSFQVTGGAVLDTIVRWDGAAWSAFGAGFPQSSVNAMVLDQDDQLVVAGFGFVSSWDGAAWAHVPAAMTGSVPHADGVEALAVLPNGDIVVGGDFATIGSAWITALARWDGTSWSMLGSLSPAEVHAMATLDTGDLVIGGEGWMPHPQARGVARWDGTSWSPLGSGVQSNGGEAVHAIAPLPNGGLIAGGQFTHAGGLPANNVARWDGASWSPLGAGINGTVRALHVLPNGDVIAGGNFWPAPGVPAFVARWDGAAWTFDAGLQAYGSGVRAIAAMPSGELLVGGYVTTAGGLPSPSLARLTTTCPANVQSIGAGCGGDTVTATLPWTGSVWRADASGLTSAALVAAVTGFTTTSLPLAAVFTTTLPGCTLHVVPDVVAVIPGANGAATFSLTLPNSPSLAGVVLHHQMVSIALDGTLAVTATNSLQLTVGSF